MRSHLMVQSSWQVWQSCDVVSCQCKAESAKLNKQKVDHPKDRSVLWTATTQLAQVDFRLALNDILGFLSKERRLKTKCN